MARDRLVALVLACLVVGTGCTGLPGSGTPAEPEGSDVRVDVSSDDDRAYVVTVGVVPAGSTGLAVEFVNGTVREYPDADGLEDLPEAVVARIVSLRPVGENVQSRTYRWDRAQGVGTTFEDVPRNATVFYSIAYPSGSEPLRALGRLTCGLDAELTTVTLRINADGSVLASNDCAVEG